MGRGEGGGCKDLNKLVHMMIYIVLPPKRTDITNTDCSKLYLKIIHKLFFKSFFSFVAAGEYCRYCHFRGFVFLCLAGLTCN